MGGKVTCLVTIHGIGFEQPPVGQVPGYADELHKKLKVALPDLLSDDPNRQRTVPGEAGAIYVQSEYPTGSGDRNEGLRRLGRWDLTHRTIDAAGAPLVDKEHAESDCVSHVALVYSNLEDVAAPHVGSAVDAGIRSALACGRYLSIFFSPGWIGRVVGGLRLGGKKSETGPSLRVRSDIKGLRQATTTGGRPSPPNDAPPDGGLGATIFHLDNDVCAYVCRNELRTRVRGFVAEALFRLCARADVAAVVVNSHSQGTVVAFDVLRGLPPTMAAKLRAFYTLGSPLRKYVDFFAWGNDAGILSGIEWINIWDPADPVADPLVPGPKWKAGMPAPDPPSSPTLMQFRDPNGGPPNDVRIIDRRVNNVANSEGGGLRAHNYWDNMTEVVDQLASGLRTVVGAPAARPAGATLL